MRSKLKRGFSALVAISMALSCLAIVSPSAKAFPLTGRVGVHDPSIVKDNGKYYVFGSHIAQAYSDDLINWTQWGKSEYEGLLGDDATGINPIFGDIQQTMKEAFKWAGYNDADCSGERYAVWAPDVFWNDDYVWKNADGQPTGETGAYMMYYSTSSTWRRSCIGYAVSKTIEGPYQAPAEGDYIVVCSGFTKESATDGSSRDVKYTNAHVGKLIEDGVFTFNDNWAKGDTTYNTNYAPNAIDPAIVTEAETGKLYMVYGSWSGGIFILEIDPKTGHAVYPKEEGETADQTGETDRYFGKRIAGRQLSDTSGNVQSIEGPYICYDENTKYYYLFATYGGLAADGGYNMRMFRSKSVTGPYKDAAGNPALFRDTQKENGITDPNTDVGLRVMGNYKFSNMDLAYKSPGHNSVFKDSDGQWYLLYHTRFSQDMWHELRVHQMFMTEDGWLVAAPYEYSGDKYTTVTKDVTGTYEMIIHTTQQGDVMMPNYFINLNDDGTISGDVTGTWVRGEGNNVTVTLANKDGVTYKGVFFEQQDETAMSEKKITFALVGNNNETVWGSKLNLNDEKIVDLALEQLSLPNKTIKNLDLPTVGRNDAKISWQSSDPTVITNDGVVTRAEQNKTATLTAAVSIGEVLKTKEFIVTVIGTSISYKPIYEYDFENATGHNNSNTIASTGTISENSNAIIVETGANTGSVNIVNDAERDSSVLHITNTATVNSPEATRSNYLRLPSDTFSDVTTDGFTVSMWVNVNKSASGYFKHSALFEANGGGQNTWKMTRLGANLVARINANSYADAIPENNQELDNVLPSNQWHFVTYTVDKSGIFVYVDGNQVAEDNKDLTSCFDKNNADSIQHSSWVALGAGDIWGDRAISDAKFDNVSIYNTALSADEVEILYNNETKPSLVSIEKLKPITDITNGTALADIKLPQTVKINTTNGQNTATISWNTKGVNYDPTNTNEQTFTVTGIITLPKDVTNPSNIELITNINVTVDAKQNSGGSTGGGSSSTTDKTETVTNSDGSTTTTVTYKDGSTTKITKLKNGSTVKVETSKDGKVSMEVKLSQYAIDDNDIVTLPVDDMKNNQAIKINLPTNINTAKVEIPVINPTSDTVAVIVKANGTEEIVKTSITTENGIKLTVNTGETVKIIDNSKTFSDISSSYWGADAVAFASSRELFNGTSENKFSPESDMNRAMIVTVLARLDGEDTCTGSTWYEASVNWAKENNISDITNINSFASREQIATMLYRYAGSPKIQNSDNTFSDSSNISSWATDAMNWAINTGLIHGMGDGTVNPQGEATRAEVATIIQRFISNIN